MISAFCSLRGGKYTNLFCISGANTSRLSKLIWELVLNILAKAFACYALSPAKITENITLAWLIVKILTDEKGKYEQFLKTSTWVETVAARGWDSKRRTDRLWPAEEGNVRGKRRIKRKGKRKQEEEEEKGEGTREEGVTGIPAAMADSSFCLHLSFPVTVPSSCLSGCKTEGLVTHTDTHSPLYLTHLLSLSLF